MKKTYITFILLLLTVQFRASAQDGPKLSPYNDEDPNGILNGIISDMVYVKAGTFNMGGGDTYILSQPVHSVTLTNDYYIGKYEVTKEQWEAIMGRAPGGCFFDEKNIPIHDVTHYDCQKFAEKLSLMTGKKFRLPTEAEWEWAARGGIHSKGYVYAGGNNINIVAWCRANSDSKVRPGGQKRPNELGLYDMSGNVAEWCSDYFKDNYYKKSPSVNPTGPKYSKNNVIRGGHVSSWDEYYCTVYGREGWETLEGAYFIGFRLVCDPE